MTPDQALDRLPEIAGAELVADLHRGPASNCYLLKRDRDQLVLRIDTPLAARLGLDRGAELEILQAVSAAGIGPEPAVARPDHGLLVTRFIPGESWSDADLRDAGNLQRLAALLQRLHAMRPTGPHLALRTVVSRYASLIGTGEAIELAAEASTLLRRLAADDTGHCLCHNDVIAPNLIDGERLSLIDWEYAAIGDPFFELAVVAQHHGLSGPHIETLLQHYLHQVTDNHRHRLHRARALYDRVLMLWLLLVQSESPLNAGQSAQIEQTRQRISTQPLP
jgi:thiamine kinase